MRVGTKVWSFPAEALAHLHIFEGPSSDETLEPSQPIMECNRPRRLMGSISGPAAEFGDDPCGPGQAFLAMRIFLQLCLALDVFIDGIEHFYFFRGERSFGAQTAFAVRA